MSIPETGAPRLDARSAADILARAQSLAKNHYLKNLWFGYEDPDDPAFQLLTIFARLMEILIERLNRVPEKNFLAFLDMVGVEPSPGHPASVPLTFLVSPKTENGGFVPAGTQVATTQTDTADAQIFETREGFFATPAKLRAVLNLLPAVDRYSLVSIPSLPPKLLELASAPTTVVLGDAVPGTVMLPHTLYLGSAALFGKKQNHDLTLVLTVGSGDASVLNATNLRWQRYSSQQKAWEDVVASYLASAPGEVTALLPGFGDNAKTKIAGRENFWIACHFD